MCFVLRQLCLNINTFMKRISVITWLLACCVAIWAQNTSDMALQSKVDNFNRQVQILPQEKIYLHTDKPYYLSGEQIYFRAYLTDAMYHIPVSVSRYVYVELLNPLDSVMARVKVRPIDNMYYGNIRLSEKWPEGAYRLRAYTHFMRNIDDNYFFGKTIYIADPSTAKLEVKTKFNFVGEKVYLNLSMKDLNAEPKPFPDEIFLKLNNAKPQKVRKTNEEYALTFKLPTDESKRILLLETDYRGYPYKKYIRVPYPDDKYAVSFYPEGGQLVAGENCRVAFKAQNADGTSANVTGHIMDTDGNVLAEFASTYQGMGLVNLNLQAGQTCYAECQRADGTPLRVKLPAAQDKICALCIRQSHSAISVNANRPLPCQAEQLYLMAHQRGNLFYAAPLTSAGVNFGIQSFTSGVVHFILLNSNFEPISERLVFVQAHDEAQALLQTDKTEYQARENVQLKVSVTHEQIPVTGNFSVSVTADKDVQLDSTCNILTNLLLTSDLRGDIENPAAYFDEKDKKATYKLDMLMLTQGWRRYNIPEMLKGKFMKPQYEVELSQKITGRVQGGLALRPVANAQVTAITQNNMYVEMTTTDSTGHFVFDKFELPDTTLVMLRALSKKGSERMVLTVDKDSFPHVQSWPYPVEAVNDNVLRQYIRQEDLKYTYENGVRLIGLDEIEVLARKAAETRSSYTSYADQSLTADQIQTVGGLTVKRLLERIGSVTVDADGTVSIRGKNPVLLLVNDVETDLAYLDDIDPYDVLRIDILYSTLAFGQRSQNGVVSISTKSLQGISDKPKFNMDKFRPLGYMQPSEFYAPVYDTPEKKADPNPDLRTTIFWKPNMQLSADGTAQIDFYTADNAGTYTILVEGISADGKIMYCKGKIENK